MRMLSGDELAEWRARRPQRSPGAKVIAAQLRETEPKHTEVPERSKRLARDVRPLPERTAVNVSVARMMLWFQDDETLRDIKVRSLMKTRRNIIGERSFQWVKDNLEVVVRQVVEHDMALIWKRHKWNRWRYTPGVNSGDTNNPR